MLFELNGELIGRLESVLSFRIPGFVLFFVNKETMKWSLCFNCFS